ncbi:MAG TPA: Gldg family protein [Chthoniobacterales bacterium]|jgi:hypothetical protein
MAKSKKSAKASFSRTGIGFGVVIQAICVVFLVIVANNIGFNYFQRWDFSRSQRFSLAEQTKQVLRQFDKPATIIVYFSASSLTLESSLAGDLENLLAEVQFSARDNLKIEWVDPTRDVSRARELQTKYKFNDDENRLILDYDGRTKFIPIRELGDFDMSGMAAGEPPRLQAFKGEAVLTAAFIELLNPKQSRIYFLQGHGEVPPADLTRLNDFITRQNAASFGLNLAAADAIPKDADAICIVGAQYDISSRELEILEKYWQDNGRIVVLIRPGTNTPNLRKLLNAACIFPRNDRVLVTVRSVTQPDLLGIEYRVAGIFMPDSPITKRLGGVNAYFVGGTSSLFLDIAAAPRGDIQVRPLILAAEQYWGEVDYLDAEKKGVRYDDGVDTGQPVIIAASAEKGGARDERTDIAASRMVVVGNSAFIEDAALADTATQGNLDFMVSVINRMIEGRSKLTGVAPRAITNYMLSLTEAQLRSIALYVLVLIPAAAALLGIIMGLRRRA